MNLLRPSHAHPRVSAWEGMHGAYDFDAHPLAPPGTAVTIHEKPDQRTTWGKHGVAGFYIGPALQHYRCYRVWASDTCSIRITDTLAWHPHGYKWEEHSPLEHVTETADALTKALQHLADSHHTAAAHRQPLQSITHELTTQFRALQRALLLPNNTPEDTGTSQRVAEPATTPAQAPAPAQATSPAPQQDKEATGSIQRVVTPKRHPSAEATVPPRQRSGVPGHVDRQPASGRHVRQAIRQRHSPRTTQIPSPHQPSCPTRPPNCAHAASMVKVGAARQCGAGQQWATLFPRQQTGHAPLCQHCR